MKKIISLVAMALLCSFIWKKIQSPEKYLKKQTQKLIALTSIKSIKSDIRLLSRISKIAEYIHFDVRWKAKYEGQIYTGKSLNEFRSLLFSYFQQNSTGKLSYKNLTIWVGEDKKQGTAHWDAFFKRNKNTVFCKILFEWIKEKKWYIKNIEVFSCVYTVFQ